MKLFSRTHGILSRHRIRDEQRLDGSRLGLDALKLRHQFIINVKPSRSVNEQRIIARLLRVLEGFAHERQRIVRLRHLEDGRARRLRDDLQLLTRRRTVNVN